MSDDALPVPGQLRIWHNSNFGHPNFGMDVPDVQTAINYLALLADYDLYQGERVTANAQGLMVWEDGDWSEWYDDEGRSIDEVAEQAARAQRLGELIGVGTGPLCKEGKSHDDE